MQSDFSKPRIWMILSSFYPSIGGEEIMTYRGSKMLAQKYDWPVTVLTCQKSESMECLPAKEEIDGFHIIRLRCPVRFKIWRFLYLRGGLWHLLRYGRGDIYDARGPHGSWIAVIAGRLFGGYSIIKLRTGRYWYEKSFSTIFGRWYFLFPLYLADRIIVVNREVELYLPTLGISPERIIRIPNSVDTNFFSPVEPGRKSSIRQKLGLPDDKTIFLFVGSLRPIKGIDVLLRSWRLLPLNIRKKSLLICVGRYVEEEYPYMINRLGIQNSVILTSERKDVREYYWAADVFVLPSRTEGLSVALLEAMSCGLLVIASNVGGAPDVVNPGENGLLFQSENYEQLAEQIVFMLNTRERWADLKVQARQAVVEYADIDICTKFRVDMYRQLIK